MNLPVVFIITEGYDVFKELPRIIIRVEQRKLYTLLYEFVNQIYLAGLDRRKLYKLHDQLIEVLRNNDITITKEYSGFEFGEFDGINIIKTDKNGEEIKYAAYNGYEKLFGHKKIPQVLSDYSRFLSSENYSYSLESDYVKDIRRGDNICSMDWKTFLKSEELIK